ncbi:alpha/beta hydrolase [Stenotrophomonas sp. HITSZ_GD]|uniref:alpha/beta hydrolase n=1 Tax=Stenotrophomonas sp. HITSZ_GD TaxID=3037248 RepID=UPI00240DA4CB|nr:alpha/beta hydrolase [Stenotrophomonas sp. HITSZ_GD]MDG2525278.1 alpha/beta hydrolase [Stenotrophomonas sp. HITSZ_GD]
MKPWIVLCVVLLAAFVNAAPAGEWRALRGADSVLPPGSRVEKALRYGDDPTQLLDVYIPAQARQSPILLIVHGGGWRRGGRDNPGLAQPKAAHWLPRGYVVVSVDYRLLPEAGPLQQADDVAHAVAWVQRHAERWGADPGRVVLMGHSAGAHLVALLGSDVSRLAAAGATRPLGVVALDSAVMDVPQMMQAPRHLRLYDDAFGTNPDDWRRASPYHHLGRDSLPMLAVCSSRRVDSCPQAQALSRRAAGFGVAIEVLPEDLSHMQINRALGEASAYTAAVDRYIDGLLAPRR